jgi:hypothetical protein
MHNNGAWPCADDVIYFLGREEPLLTNERRDRPRSWFGTTRAARAVASQARNRPQSWYRTRFHEYDPAELHRV